MKRKLLVAAVAVVVAAIAGIYGYQHIWPPTKPEINILVWGGYEDPALIRPFEEKYGIKVNYKTFFGGDAMFALLTQSRGIYDVVVVDPEYIQKLYALGRLAA